MKWCRVNSKLKNKTTISVITATFNASSHLPSLIDSLQNQTDKNFQWVVADGASSDGTLELLQSIDGLNIEISSQVDFGIYDALNRAIKISSGEYYIICGADDFFYEDAIQKFRSAIEHSKADIIVANALYGNKKLIPKNTTPWLWGHLSHISAHTLATAFNKKLHDSIGYYSRKYPIAADQLFVMQAFQENATRSEVDFISGEIGSDGVSSVDRVGNATEMFRVQLDLGRSSVIQMLLLIARLIRFY